MFFNKTIQKGMAALMLMLFALSVTPKLWLHDTITGHRHHYTVDTSIDHHLQHNSKSFHCHWNDQLVESPFTGHPDFRLDLLLPFHDSFYANYLVSPYSSDLVFTSLRGPPVLVTVS